MDWIDAEVASYFSDWEGVSLDLSGVTRLDADTGSEITKWRGAPTSGFTRLRLNGVEELSPEAASALAKWGDGWEDTSSGGILGLNGLTELRAESAAALAGWEPKYGALHLNGVPRIGVDQARALSRFRGGILQLNGLEELDARTAAELAEWDGRALFLNGLCQIDADTAEVLAWIIHDMSTAAHQPQNPFISLLDDALHRLRGSILGF